MAQATFGTNSLTGLNIGTAPDKIADHELQSSENGWTDRDGVWSTARGAEKLYTGYSDISCFAAGRMDGSTHLVWMDGSTVYDNGANVGTITAGSSMKIIALDDAFLILGASVNYLYDGAYVRQHGAPQDDLAATLEQGIDTEYLSNGYFLKIDTSTSPVFTTITGATKANPCVITTAATHYLETGTRVVISGSDMTELNGNTYTITDLTSTTFSLRDPETGNDINSSAYAAVGTSGDLDVCPVGISGVYSYCAVPTITLSSGRVLSGSPTPLTGRSVGSDFSNVSDPQQNQKSEEMTFATTDAFRFQYSWSSTFSISGTAGTDYYRGYRIYRTKADGTDYYLLKEGDETDSDCTSGNLGRTFDYTLDRDLGAVLTYGVNDHAAPPVSSLAVPVGQRLFVNDVDNPDHYHWSHLDGIEYYTELGWNKLPDSITSMSQMDNHLVMTSQDRLWTDSFTGGLPNVREFRTDTGSKTGIATTTDDGVLMLEKDGLWLFDGVRVTKLSRRSFDELDTPKSICSTKDTTYMSGLYDSYVVRQRDSGMVWHGGDGTYPLSDASGGAIYAASSTNIVEMFEGPRAGGTLVTKAWNLGLDDAVSAKVKLDIQGSSVPTVWVDGNRQSVDAPSYASSTDNTEGKRRLVWVYVKRLVNHVAEIKLEATGELHVYGAWLEVER